VKGSLAQDANRRIGKLLCLLTLSVGLLLSVVDSAVAAESAATYDKADVRRNEHCIEVKQTAAVVRDIEGNPVQTNTAGQLLDPPAKQAACEKRKNGGLDVQGIEAITSNGQTLYSVWTGNPAVYGQYDGFVSQGELASTPPVRDADDAENGAAAPVAPGGPVYRVTPEDMWAPVGPNLDGDTSELNYKGGAELYSFDPYGRPVGGAKYALMLWTWIDVSDGGFTRAAVSEGALFYPANVEPIESHTLNTNGEPNGGIVVVRYGYVTHAGNAGTEKTYGWMVTSHSIDGACYDHMEYVGGGSPLANTLCPPVLAAPILQRFGAGFLAALPMRFVDL
jgi:hypothetical protein